MNMSLKPCPFCGDKPKVFSCDRLIQIGCDNCNFHVGFQGLIGNKITDVPVHYSDGTISDYEFYNKDAYKEAEEKWNMRTTKTIKYECER